MSLQDTTEQFLDRVFKEMGLVGSVCLVGPDPQKGGMLMTISCVYQFLFMAYTVFMLISSIHKSHPDGTTLEETHHDYERAVADPMRSYSELFFCKNFSFLLT